MSEKYIKIKDLEEQLNKKSVQDEVNVLSTTYTRKELASIIYTLPSIDEKFIETIENNAYLHKCKCPNCGTSIFRGFQERIFYCEQCGTQLHQRAFTQKEIDDALFEHEMDEYED